VKTGREQLSDARAILEAQTGIGRSRLLASSQRLLKTLDELPGQAVAEHQLRQSTMWSQSDEDRLVELATALGPAFATRTPEIVSALVWIRHLHGRIMQINPAMGYRTTQTEDLAFSEHRKRALDGLRSIINDLRA